MAVNYMKQIQRIKLKISTGKLPFRENENDIKLFTPEIRIFQ